MKEAVHFPDDTEKIFKVVTADIEINQFTIYSEEWSKLHCGHSGSPRSLGKLMDDKRGHWNVTGDKIELIEPASKLEIGDEVLYYGELFTIVGLTRTGYFIIFSKGWNDIKKGHNGMIFSYPGNGCEYGHYYVPPKDLKKHSNYEIHRANSERCSGGIESQIYSQPIKIASGCRPTGSRTTSCRIGIKVRQGIVSNNRIQSY